MSGISSRSAVAAFLTLIAIVHPASMAGASPPCLLPPVSGHVADPFREPGCPFCAGNRGLEIMTAAGSIVVAAAAGVISFAGVVAGTRYVVVDHGGGYRTSYGKLQASRVRVGDHVDAGESIGVSGATTFFGLRLEDTYLDPAPHLAVTEPRPQLVPLDGSHRRVPRPPRYRC